MKEIINITKDPDFDWFEIDIRVPGFDNFGKRFGEIEKQAWEALLAADQTPEGQAETRDNIAAMAAQINRAVEDLQVLEQAGGPGSDPLSDSMGELAKMLEEIPKAMAEEQAGLLSPEEIDSEDDSFDRDHESLQVSLEEGAEWNSAAEARVDRFLSAWPELRPRLLREAFAHYQSVYPQLEELAKVPGGNLQLPAPTAPEVIEDLFIIGDLFLFGDGRVGVSGDCSWDDEHGFGAVITGSEVTEFGDAEIARD